MRPDVSYEEKQVREREATATRRESASAVTCEQITTLAGMEALAPAWAALTARDPAAHLFQGHPWLMTWLRHHPETTPRIFVARRGGRLTAALPLCAHQVGRAPLTLRELRFIADEDSDYCQPLVDPACQEDFTALWATLAQDRHWDLLDLRYVLPGSPLDTVLQEGTNRLRCVRQEQGIAPYLELGEDWLESLEKRQRQDMQRCRRRLAEQGKVSFTVARTAAEVDSILAQLAEMHRARWDAQGEISRFNLPAYREWLRDACLELLPRGQLYLCRLALNEETMCAAIYFLYRRRLLFYIPSFAAAYRKFGPAYLLVAEAAADARARELATVHDFGRGGEEYKLRWTRQMQTLDRILLARSTPAGFAAFWWHHRARPMLQRNERVRAVAGRALRVLARRREMRSNA